MDAWRPKYKWIYDLMENAIYAIKLAAMVAAFIAAIIYAI